MSRAVSSLYEHSLNLLIRAAGTVRSIRGAGPDPSARGAHGRESVGTRYGEHLDESGRSHPIFMTHDDWILNQIDVTLSLGRFLTEDDIVVVAVPYELSFIGAELDRAVEMIGASVISIGTGHTICPMPRLLELIRMYEATALICSPTLATDLASLAISLQQRPESWSVRSIICVGEACSRKRLDRIGAAWDATVLALYGTPSIPAVALPCERGALHVCDHRLRASVLGARGGRIDSDGTRGELLLAMPSAAPGGNCATGELVELWPADRKCACGDDRNVLVPLGRVADAVPSPFGPVSRVDVERIVFDCIDLSPHFACEVREGGFDVTCAMVGAESTRDDGLKHSIENRVRDELGLNVEVSIVGMNDWSAAFSRRRQAPAIVNSSTATRGDGTHEGSDNTNALGR